MGYFIIWYLIGLIATIIWVGMDVIKGESVKVKDIPLILACALLGVVTLMIVIVEAITRNKDKVNKFFDTTIIKGRDSKE